MKFGLFTALVLLFCTAGYAQIQYSSNNYIEYHKGTLPIIISVPHDGSMSPSSIPDRTCNNATNVTDLNTYKLGQQIDSSLFALTGCHPHMIYCNLKRSKLDCNRNLADGACGNPAAEQAWAAFHDFIDNAQAIAQNQNAGKAFYIDLHGHGHTMQRLELGYLYTATELGSTDAVLNTPLYMSYNSIQNLVATNINGYSNAEMLRGEFALGSLLGNAGYAAVPSIQFPAPGSDPYFSGGYNTANHTSYAIGNTVNGLQIECNLTNVRDSYQSRKVFSDSLALVLQRYLYIHQNMDIKACTPSVGVEQSEENGQSSFVFPTLVAPNTPIRVVGIAAGDGIFVITNALGQMVETGIFNTTDGILEHKELPRGINYIAINNTTQRYSFRIMVY
jgi:hypothetical protein